MMKISFIAVWLSLAAGAVAAMFHIAFEVEKLEVHLYDTNRQIVSEQETIHVLQAEWSYLNRPQRLESLSKELLPNLMLAASTQFITFARLPKRGDVGGAIAALPEVPTVAPARFSPAANSSVRGRLQ
jgi:hypothetical protein